MYRQHYPEAPGMHVNMADSHTRTTYTRNPTFLERIGQSCMGIAVGAVLLCVATVLLFWNEGRAVQTAQSLDEGLKIVIPLATTDVAFEENNFKLVHLTGTLRTDKVLNDPIYNVAVHAVKLKRNVEMYLWVEHESTREINEGSHTRKETTYSYSKEWRNQWVNSNSFSNRVGHHNPDSFPVQSITYKAQVVQAGSFYLSPALIEKVSKFQQVDISNIQPSDQTIKKHLGRFYHGHNPNDPQVGDLRVTLEYAGLSGKSSSKIGPPETVSIIAKQHGQQLIKYQTDAGDSLELLYEGEFTAQQMFDKEHATNSMITWAVRFGGWLLMFIGFGCLTRIVVTLVDWLPIVRELVTLGVTSLNLTFSIGLSLTIIALGWIRYRPMLGFAILALAAAPFLMNKWRAQRSRRPTPSAPPRDYYTPTTSQRDYYD